MRAVHRLARFDKALVGRASAGELIAHEFYPLVLRQEVARSPLQERIVDRVEELAGLRVANKFPQTAETERLTGSIHLANAAAHEFHLRGCSRNCVDDEKREAVLRKVQRTWLGSGRPFTEVEQQCFSFATAHNRVLTEACRGGTNKVVLDIDA